MDTQSELNYLANMKPPDTFGHTKYQSTYDLMNRHHTLDMAHTQMMPTQPLVTHVEHIPPPPPHLSHQQPSTPQQQQQQQQQQLSSASVSSLASNGCMPSSYVSPVMPTLGASPLIQQQTAIEMQQMTQQSQQTLPTQQQQPPSQQHQHQQIQSSLLAPIAPVAPLTPLTSIEASSSNQLGVHLPPHSNSNIINNNFCNNNALDAAAHFTLNYNNNINNINSSNNMDTNMMMNANANANPNPLSIPITSINNNGETAKRKLSTDTTLDGQYPSQKKDKQQLAQPLPPQQQQQQPLQLQQQQQQPQQSLPLIDEKKKRKNIRDVMDTNQLDTITLKAQHEESERLARMAEQQKLLREYQQREAVLTHFDRFVNEHRVKNPEDLLELSGSPKNQIMDGDGEDDDKKTSADTEIECKESDEGSDLKEKTPAEVVTIEDSSSDDDCIVLSDDEEDLDDDIDDPENSGLHVKDEFNIPDHLGRVVINVGHPDNEEDIFIAPQIARTIKPHQIGGIRFLFDNIIESTTRFKISGGFGCILAHSMGLGKTLQVVCFCDIFLRYTPSKTVVCVMPINTLQNWQAEFDMWIPKISDNYEYVRPRQFDVFVLNDQHKTFSARARVILQWKEMGGVLLIGYELFRLMALKLSTTGRKRSKRSQLRNDEMDESHHRLMDEIYEALVKPGPDLVICDEGHRIKNSQAGISQALKQIRTRRRIVLTGYPLQNNLIEYWCMVDFVRPNYLGTKTEFCNMFERPIQNGLCVDSTPDDIKLMRYRAHVLHSLLLGFVQRRSHTVLQLSLPEKQEFVILTRMTELQRQLYDTFMNDIVRAKNVPNPLKAFAVCCKIWNHPDVLYDAMKVAEYGLDLDIEEVEEINPNVTNSASINGGPKLQSLLAPPPPLPLPQSTSTFISPQSNVMGLGRESSHVLNNNSMMSPCSPMTNGQSTSQLHTNSLGLNIQQDANTSQQLNCHQMGRQDFLRNNNAINNNINNTINYNTNFPNLGDLENPSRTTNPMNSIQMGTTTVNSTDTINYQNSTSTPLYSDLNHYSDGGNTSGNGNINGNSNSVGSSISSVSALNSAMNNSSSYQSNDLQSSYFSYSSMLSSMGSPLKPNYVGCMVKQTTNTNTKMNANGDNINIASLDETQTHNSSSEIVDLDTKEIKTIETDIDMDKNIQLNKQKEEGVENGSSNGSMTNTNNKSIVMPAAINANSQNGSGFMDNEVKNDGMGISSFSGLQTALENNSNLSNMNSTQEQEQRRGCDKITYDWASKFMKKYEPGLISNSPKMTIFFCILNESVRIGDRVLLFSQSLLTLNVIEKFLSANLVPGDNMNWTYGRHYFRLDGSTTSQERERLVNEFNTNPNVKLFLISTKAGSLGINLIGANRVIIFDASWNPCHDTQAIYRIYRYGQKRACFVYRIVMDKCLEKKIYDRQIKKQGMSDRVVDECNPDNHLSIKDVTNLCYDYDDDDAEKNTTTLEFKKTLDSYTDTIIRKVLEEYKCHLTKEPFFHESLLVDRKNDKLSQAEKRMAHRSYEMQKKTSSKNAFISTGSGNRVQFQTIRKDGALITKPIASVRPMQAPRSQTQKYSSGLRTTRWIPAEVWQKQGMTAQEMSLPLDVVIPTNSSNKSKIIIKAGQRVMVLKSAKGIYMQLDSGKIIAIRTMNKPNAINKSNDKTDVIDITGESETNANDAKTEKAETETTNSSFTDSSMDVDSSTSTTSSGLQKTLKNELDKTSEIETTHKTQSQQQLQLQSQQKQQQQAAENLNQAPSQFNQLALLNNNKHNTTTTTLTTAAATITTPTTAGLVSAASAIKGNINVASSNIVNNNNNQHHNHNNNNNSNTNHQHHHNVTNAANNIYHHNNHNLNTNNNINTVNTGNPLKNDDKSVHRVQQQQPQIQQQHTTTIHDNRQQVHVTRNQQQQSLLMHHQQQHQHQHKQQHHHQQHKQLQQQQHRTSITQNPNENIQHSTNSNNNTNLAQQQHQQQHHQQHQQQSSHGTTTAAATATPTHNIHHHQQQHQQQQATANNYAAVNHHAANAANAAAAAVAAAHQHHSHHHHHHPQSYYTPSHAYASAAAAAAAAAANQSHHSQSTSLRNAHHHHYGAHAGRTASDISPYSSYAAATQYTEFPTYASSHDTLAQQNARYHGASGSHSNLTQTHPTSLSDFYTYYQQWSPYMLPPPPPPASSSAAAAVASTAAAAVAAVAAAAAANPNDTTNHLMHHSYPSAHGHSTHSAHSHVAHSHSSLPKVQSANNSGGSGSTGGGGGVGGASSQWQQYQ